MSIVVLMTSSAKMQYPASQGRDAAKRSINPSARIERISMKKIFTLLLFAGAATMAFPSYAAPIGMQAGFGVGKSSVSSDQYEDSNSDIVGGNVGYRFNENVALEGFYRTLKFRLLDRTFRDYAYYPSEHLGVAVLASAKLAKHFTVYGRLGLGTTKMHSADANRDDHFETDPSIGVGITIPFNQRIALRFESTRLTKTEVNTHLIGMEFSF